MFKIETNIIVILFLLLLVYKYKCAVYLPFKILENNINENNDIIDIVKYWKELKLYTELMIGEPPKKIGVFFVSDIFELTLFQNMCDIKNSFYSKDNSSSYKYIKSINYLFNKVMNCLIITEKLNLYLDKEQKKNISIDNVIMVYSDNKEEEFNQDEYYKDDYKDRKYEYHPNTCLNIGFQPRQNFNFGGKANFIQQIKLYKINNNSLVNSYDYTFQFTSDKDGYLIIGEKPHEFDKNNYKEEQYILTGAKDRNYTFEWIIEFNSIYYTGINVNNNTLYNSTFTNDLSVIVDITYGLIEGTDNYEKNITKDFFEKFFNNKQCFIRENENDGYKFFYCDIKIWNYIAKYFPVLKFCLHEYNMCFDFRYTDLFRVKNDKLYFLIYFNKNNKSNRFKLGQIFLKKYLVTFNFDSKMIGFYNKNIKNEDETVEKKYYEHDIIFIILIIIGFIIFFIAGFFVGKKIYEKTRRKKANELEDEYDYESQDKKEEKPQNAINN